MPRSRTHAALVVWLLVPAVAGAQSANAAMAPGSPTADRLPIYEIDPTWPSTLPIRKSPGGMPTNDGSNITYQEVYGTVRGRAVGRV